MSLQKDLYHKRFGGPKVDEAVKRVEMQLIVDDYELHIKPGLRRPGLFCWLRLMFVPIIEKSVPVSAINGLGDNYYMVDLLGNPVWQFKYYKGSYYNYGPGLPPEY